MHSAPNTPDGDIPISFKLSPSCIFFYHTPNRACLYACYFVLSAFLFALPTVSVSPVHAWGPPNEQSSYTAQTTEKHSAVKHVTIPQTWDPLMVSMLKNEVVRLEINNPDWPLHVDAFIEMVKNIESDSKRYAYNTSGAMSYFQFKKESIKTAHLRLLNYTRRHKMERVPRWSVALYYKPETIYDVSAERQAVLMIANIIEQDHERGADRFARLLQGDLRAAKETYYKYHHTAPDPFTLKRTERLFAYYF